MENVAFRPLSSHEILWGKQVYGCKGDVAGGDMYWEDGGQEEIGTTYLPTGQDSWKQGKEHEGSIA